MESTYQKVKNYLIALDLMIVHESQEDQVFIVQNDELGIHDMVIACPEPILIIEQTLFSLKENLQNQDLIRLLQMNREIVHGALTIDEAGENVIFRDSLQTENLDLNELEGSLNSLGLFLSEFSNEIIKLAK